MRTASGKISSRRFRIVLTNLPMMRVFICRADVNSDHSEINEKSQSRNFEHHVPVWSSLP